MSSTSLKQSPSPQPILAAPDSFVHVGRGLLQHADSLVAPLIPQKRALVVVDPNAASHLPPLIQSLQRADVHVVTHVLPKHGESAKTFEQLHLLILKILDADIQRDGAVVSLGGGAVCDVVGLAASLAKRGVRLFHFPSTLLAQVDAAVGGKTAVNTTHGKNLVGSFHQPHVVVVDPNLLQTLPVPLMRDAHAEIVKAALIGNPNLLLTLENLPAPLPHDLQNLPDVIADAVRVKARLVAQDPLERSQRAFLNLGHTVAHAAETLSNHAASHGEAVSVGLIVALSLSQQLVSCPQNLVTRVQLLLQRANLPTRLHNLPIPINSQNPDAFLNLIARDKKNTDGRLRFILLQNEANPLIHTLSNNDVDALRNTIHHSLHETNS